jgi:sorbitol/mannitol transport system substrate-binding protein
MNRWLGRWRRARRLALSSVLSSALWLALTGGAAANAATDLVVATLNNAHMIEMQRLTPQFERANPDIRVQWVTLEEGALRQRVTQDAATGAGRFDVVTVGLYEAQVWSRKGWLREITPPPAYDLDDLLPAIRSGLSIDGRLYGAPFYGESSMLMFRKDLTEKAGIRFAERPSWAQVREAARRLHDPQQGVYGICLRGKPGWGENVTLLSTMANSQGGQWFNMDWKPQLDSKAWQDALKLYVELLSLYGPPAPTSNGFNELLALFKAGRCAMWVDATIAASFLNDPRYSRVAGQVGYAQAPAGTTAKGASWLWAWALAIPSATPRAAAAQRFVAWATSKAYIEAVAADQGWAAVPTGTRRSTYANPAFVRVAGFAAAEKRAIDSVDGGAGSGPRKPYFGVQFAAIPEFQAIGIAVGQQVAAALAGRSTVPQALKAAQQAADREMRQAGYYP